MNEYNEYEAMLNELQQQEEELQFTSFPGGTALAIGMALLQEAKNKQGSSDRYYTQWLAAFPCRNERNIYR